MSAEERAVQRARDRQEQADGDLRELLKSPGGRRFLFGLIDGLSGTMSVSFRPEQPHFSAYLEGRRSVGVDVTLECQRVAPSDFVHMLSEAFQTREAERLAEVEETKRKELDDAG